LEAWEAFRGSRSELRLGEDEREKVRFELVVEVSRRFEMQQMRIEIRATVTAEQALRQSRRR
jgi:hypothetical protein